jgi:hypothetical protein
MHFPRMYYLSIGVMIGNPLQEARILLSRLFGLRQKPPQALHRARTGQKRHQIVNARVPQRAQAAVEERIKSILPFGRRVAAEASELSCCIPACF